MKHLPRVKARLATSTPESLGTFAVRQNCRNSNIEVIRFCPSKCTFVERRTLPHAHAWDQLLLQASKKGAARIAVLL